jgi:TRAP-type C4-dicarboxylate transport system permease small subunit
VGPQADGRSDGGALIQPGSSGIFVRRTAAAAAGAGAALLIGAVFVAILLGVARRYLFGAPLVWIDELTTVLFVWTIFWTGAFVLGVREHVSFDLVHQALPPRVAGFLWRTVCLIVAVALLLALPKLWNFVTFLWRERTPALQWRLDYVYACFVVFVAAAGLRFAWEAVRRR